MRLGRHLLPSVAELQRVDTADSDQGSGDVVNGRGWPRYEHHPLLTTLQKTCTPALQARCKAGGGTFTVRKRTTTCGGFQLLSSDWAEDPTGRSVSVGGHVGCCINDAVDLGAESQLWDHSAVSKRFWKDFLVTATLHKCKQVCRSLSRPQCWSHQSHCGRRSTSRRQRPGQWDPAPRQRGPFRQTEAAGRRVRWTACP